MTVTTRCRTRIKFCGLVRPEDVHVAASLGVDAIGLVFYDKSPRALDLPSAGRLRRLVPSWMSVVGLFVNAPPALVKGHSQALGLDVIQFHGDEDEAHCQASLLDDQPYWRAVRIRDQSDLLNSVAHFDGAECLLLDAFSPGYGGAGRAFDWSAVPPDHGRSLIVSGGLDASSVAQAISRFKPVGVDVSTGIQGADARTKDAGKMAAFVAAVVSADADALNG